MGIKYTVVKIPYPNMSLEQYKEYIQSLIGTNPDMNMDMIEEEFSKLTEIED